MANYKMTPRRRVALRKAQLASARKRQGKSKSKVIARKRKNRPTSTPAVISKKQSLARRSGRFALKHRNKILIGVGVASLAGRIASDIHEVRKENIKSFKFHSAQLRSRNPIRRQSYAFKHGRAYWLKTQVGHSNLLGMHRNPGSRRRKR